MKLGEILDKNMPQQPQPPAPKQLTKDKEQPAAPANIPMLPAQASFDLTKRQTNALLEVVRGTVFLNQRATRQDVECLLLGRRGFGAKVIAARCSLSVAQVYYRLRLAGVSSRQYQRGLSPLAKIELEQARRDSTAFYETIQSKIRRYLKDQQWQQPTQKTISESTTE